MQQYKQDLCGCMDDWAPQPQEPIGFLQLPRDFWKGCIFYLLLKQKDTESISKDIARIL